MPKPVNAETWIPIHESIAATLGGKLGTEGRSSGCRDVFALDNAYRMMHNVVAAVGAQALHAAPSIREPRQPAATP